VNRRPVCSGKMRRREHQRCAFACSP
jgi:hypothetical protein